MTFKEFQGIVKRFRPELEVSRHGEYGYNGKYTLGVIYPNGKIYNYSGSYCSVLQKLNIPVVYKKELESLKSYLAELETENGTEDIYFGGIIDNSEAIAQYKAKIKEFEENYIII